MGRKPVAAAISCAVAVGIVLGVAGCQMQVPGVLAAAPQGGAGMSAALPASPSPSAQRVPGTTSSSARSTPAPLTVATVGDSIMAGHGLDPAQAWPMLLGAQTGVVVSNFGCSGAGFVAVGDCDTDYSGLVDQAAAVHPDVVIIQSSDNDFGQSDDAIAAATHATVASLRAALPTAEIVGLSTLWDQPGDIPDQVASTSDDLRDAVESVGGTFIDLGQPLADQAVRDGEYGTGAAYGGDGGDTVGDGSVAPTDTPSPTDTPAPVASAEPPVLQGDFEHPTAAGQELLAEAIGAALDAMGIHL